MGVLPAKVRSAKSSPPAFRNRPRTAVPRANMQKTDAPASDDKNPSGRASSEKAAADRGDNVDKIRDILFGTQMREYDKRMTRFEERLAKELQEIREESKRRYAALESFVKSELDALGDRLKAEQGERATADREASREFKETIRAIEKRLSQMDEQATKVQRDLRDQILQEVKRLSDALQQSQAETFARLEGESQEIRSAFTDRLALADLFAEVALRLKNEFKVPPAD